MTQLRSVCVFCGSRPGADAAYADEARALGALIAAEGWRLVYGAGDVGLMGEVARSAQGAGARTLGVIPTHLMMREQGRRDLTTLVITEDMHERKKVMFMNSDVDNNNLSIIELVIYEKIIDTIISNLHKIHYIQFIQSILIFILMNIIIVSSLAALVLILCLRL